MATKKALTGVTFGILAAAAAATIAAPTANASTYSQTGANAIKMVATSNYWGTLSLTLMNSSNGTWRCDGSVRNHYTGALYDQFFSSANSIKPAIMNAYGSFYSESQPGAGTVVDIFANCSNGTFVGHETLSVTYQLGNNNPNRAGGYW